MVCGQKTHLKKSPESTPNWEVIDATFSTLRSGMDNWRGVAARLSLLRLDSETQNDSKPNELGIWPSKHGPPQGGKAAQKLQTMKHCNFTALNALNSWLPHL